MLAGIFLLSSCDNLKGLIITQIDVKNQKANPFKITKVDKKECKIEVEDMPSIELLSNEMHGAFCLTASEFAIYKAKLQSDCKTENETKDGR